MVVRQQSLAPPKPAGGSAADPRPVAVPGTTGVTLAEFAGMRDIGMATELVRGEIVEVPRPVKHHGRYCVVIASKLLAWANDLEKGDVYGNDTGYVLEDDPGTLRGPDVMFISWERLGDEEFEMDDWLRAPPELAVEVKSPSESWPDTRRKAVEYLESGVGEVWVLDALTRRLRVHRDPGGQPITLGEGDAVTSPLLPGFSCTVAALLPGRPNRPAPSGSSEAPGP